MTARAFLGQAPGDIERRNSGPLDTFRIDVRLQVGDDIRYTTNEKKCAMTTLSDIQLEIAALPPNLRAEVLDFARFVRQRHGLPAAPVATTPETGDSSLFRALEAVEFVGCIDTNEQLSTTYKSQLNFSAKHGSR